MFGSFTQGTIHLSALAHLAFLQAPTVFAGRLPQPTRLPHTRSRGFRRAWSTTRPSDSSTRVPSHFASAYRVGHRGATRGLAEVSRGHALVFRTVPSANTLVRWVDESAFASIVQARPCPTFGRPVRHGVAPSTTARYFSASPSDPTSRWAPCHPQLPRGGCRSTLAVSGFRLRARLGFSIPSSCGRRGITPAFGYGPPHPGAGGTPTLLTSALPGAHYGPLRLPHRPLSEASVEGRDPSTMWASHVTWRAFLTCHSYYPGGPRWVHSSVASPRTAAFPLSQVGRRPRLHFRGLLRIHSRYGP